MSSIFESQKKEQDFLLFKDEILKINDTLSKDVSALPEFKKFHSLLYALSLIQIKVTQVEKIPNRTVFLQEIRSDLLLLITHAIFGYHNTSMMTYRKVIENFYNHIFYFNHEIEFFHLNNGKNEYTPIINLKNYLITHPKFLEDKLNKDFNDYIFNEYTKLNNYVHAKGIHFMGLAKSLQDLRQTIDYSRVLYGINITIYKIIFLLFKFHNNIKFQPVELKLITDCIPKTMRKKLME
ncbi:MAG: hypothetical protein FWC34_10910 [Bacteroidetes bacterium]|nr:hypothetical protein [Bacteroidota bacterium]MCL2302948.1 hypothetical protein [Lentimicrobiaceae bacterium]